MQNLKDGDSLSESEERKECFVKAMQMVVREEKRDKKDSTEGRDAPQDEADAIVGEKVVLPRQKGLGATRIRIGWVFHWCDAESVKTEEKASNPRNRLGKNVGSNSAFHSEQTLPH